VGTHASLGIQLKGIQTGRSATDETTGLVYTKLRNCQGGRGIGAFAPAPAFAMWGLPVYRRSRR